MILRRALGALGLIILLSGIAASQSPQGSISDISVVDLMPFEVSFRYTNSGGLPQANVSGTVSLQDRFGRSIERLTIEAFSAAPGESQILRVRSRWEFQQTGIYLLEIALDFGSSGLLSNAFGFRILPIPLPLAPVEEPDGAGLMTIYQRPVSWGLERVMAPEAWTLTHGSPSIVVAVIDSGIDRSIDQLAEAMWRNPGEIPGNGRDDDANGYIDDVYGWDFRDGDNDSLSGSALHAHGTIIASILAARPGEQPIVGVAPGVKVMDVRFLDSSNSFRAADWGAFTEAVDYAVDNGARIINLSIYANGQPPRDFQQALDRAAAKGVIVVGITGNGGEATVMYPGRLETVLAVSATTESNLLASFSNRGDTVGVCAPGQSITAFTIGGSATTQSGTSFAAPHVSGVLALMLSLSPRLTASEAIGILLATSTDLGSQGPDDMYGAGLVDALAALQGVRP